MKTLNSRETTSSYAASYSALLCSRSLPFHLRSQPQSRAFARRFIQYRVSFRHEIQLLRPIAEAAEACLSVRPTVRLGAAEQSHVRRHTRSRLRACAVTRGQECDGYTTLARSQMQYPCMTG